MPAATRNDGHLAEDCRDEHCQRFPCRLYKEAFTTGYQAGYDNGYATGHGEGYGQGYAAGFDAGLASCRHGK